ncbi:hypothetical protein QM467_08665 [Rhodoblastus sp. 17X3]|uniref:hypothetical protein n=1 Tax=Rhodoblastus sp. 17X3 TaxID=3047026 RepID=UPI0024B6A560|nr:hypothetical protein [Rhodoblastus sp. 17X3]MDI9848123.1 hypothetical protein [Rhodoblastus sp. 17X3]
MAQTDLRAYGHGYFFNLTPAPPRFSWMNSTPAASGAVTIDARESPKTLRDLSIQADVHTDGMGLGSGFHQHHPGFAIFLLRRSTLEHRRAPLVFTSGFMDDGAIPTA